MEKTIIEFMSSGQKLERLQQIRTFASDTVNYIEAQFELSDTWSGYDNVYAVWYTDDIHTKSSEIIDGVTIIPAEILSRPGTLMMNLCANKSENGVLVARMTSYPVEALKLRKSHA